MKTLDIEIAVMEYFNIRTNLIVPNVSWGIGLHECDLLVITKAGCAYEVEIKTSKTDLIKDKEKRHGHFNSKIKQLYFAIPMKLVKYMEHIPERAGIFGIREGINTVFKPKCEKLREARINSKYKFSEGERYQVARLGAMRILGLKKRIKKLKEEDNTGILEPEDDSEMDIIRDSFKDREE